MAVPGRSALLLGATGATGSYVLQELLASSHFTRVIEVGRRVTSPDVLANTPGKEKLTQKVVDFEKIDQAGLKGENADVVIITLGTSRAAAGSAENFTKIDRLFPAEAAKAAKTDSEQRLIYVSAGSANPNSFILYSKSKGLTELDLASLGYKDFIVFRPALLTERPNARVVEAIASKITGLLSTFTSSVEISVKVLAKSVTKAAELGSGNLPAVAGASLHSPPGVLPYHIIFNKGALNLARS